MIAALGPRVAQADDQFVRRQSVVLRVRVPRRACIVGSIVDYHKNAPAQPVPSLDAMPARRRTQYNRPLCP